MYIETIKIGSFGKLSRKEIELTDGMNVIEGNNESGKTTLCEFIKFVFYGLSNRSTDGKMSERKRHVSWKTNDISGSIVLNTSKGKFRIERSMIPHGTEYKDSVTVVDLSNNSIMSGIKNPGEHFFGIPEEVFVRTVYIRQADGAYFNGESIGRAVENIFYSADESVNTDRALKKIDEARLGIKHKKNTGRGMLDRLEAERDELTFRLEEARTVNERILQIESSINLSEQAVEKNRRDAEKCSDQLRKAELYSLLKRIDEKNSYKKKHEKYVGIKKEIIEKTSYNGFFPNEEYCKELDGAKKELEYLKKDVEKYDLEKGFVSEEGYSKAVAEKIKEYGGKKGIKAFLSMQKTKKKTFGICAAILFGAALGSALIGFFVEQLMYLASVLFLLLSVLCCCFSLATTGKIKKVFSIFDSSNEAELFEVVNKTEQAERDEIRNNELMLYKERNKAIAQEKLDNHIEMISVLLGKWGITLDDMNHRSVISCLETVLYDLNEIDGSIKACEDEISKYYALYSHMEEETSKLDYQNLKEEFDSIEVSVDYDDLSDVKRKKDFAIKAIDSLTVKLRELEKTLASLKSRTDRPSELETRLNYVNATIRDLKHKHDAYVLAYEKLQEAGVSLRGKLAPGLSMASGKYMAGLTDGKYGQIGVSDSLDMTYSFEEDGTDYTKEVEVLSSGTRDIAYVSLRLALAELFGRSGERLPVVFDESFARLDNGRLKNMLSVAQNYAQNNSQSIILTSHAREADVMREVGGKFKHIYM